MSLLLYAFRDKFKNHHNSEIRFQEILWQIFIESNKSTLLDIDQIWKFQVFYYYISIVAFSNCLFYLVTPSPVIIKDFFQNSNDKCGHEVQWKLLNTGCKVEYNIQFNDRNNSILGVKTSILGNKTFFCTNDYSSAWSVIMWATFNNIRGENSTKFLREFTTTTTTSTPTTVTSTIEGNIHCENWWKKYVKSWNEITESIMKCCRVAKFLDMESTFRIFVEFWVYFSESNS